MKKILGFLLSLIMVCTLFGCTKTTEQTSSVQLPNPIHDSTAEDILKTLGITMKIPGDAQNTSYSIIELANESSIAQAKFSRSDVDYTYRIRPAKAFEDISGAYYDWTSKKNIEVSYCSGEVRFIEGKQGICLWYDAVPGLMYCIYAESGASEKSLLTLANELFIPAKDVP